MSSFSITKTSTASGVGSTVELAEIESLTKGSIIVGDGAGSPAELLVGASNGHVLTVDSTTSTGLKYASVPAAGSTELTGDVTGSGTGTIATTIANNSVSYAKMQDVSATDKLLGRSTAGSGDIEEITCTAAGRALLDDSSAANQRTTLSAAASGANTDLTSVFLSNTGLKIKDTDSSHGLTIIPGSNILADRTLTLLTGNNDRILDITGGDAVISGTNSGDQIISLTGDVTGSGTGSFAATIALNAVTTTKIADDNVTYAKIQNVSATDKILGRSTAGSGNVEEIDCTAAGRAILDDATASDQRTTLGLGSIATQAANSVSITGGSISGITDLVVADGGTGASTFTDAGVLIGNGTGVIQATTAGSSGQVLTSNGAGVDPTFQSIPGGSSIPQNVISTIFESTNRFSSSTVGSGSRTINTDGLFLQTSPAASSAAANYITLSGNSNVFTLGTNNYFSTLQNFGISGVLGTDCAGFVGMGEVTTTGLTLFLTNIAQYGFKFVRAASVSTTSATNSDGSGGETVTNFTDWNTNFWQTLHAQKTGTTNIKFYLDKTLKATHTLLLPNSTSTSLATMALNNANVATNTAWNFFNFTFSYDVQ